MYCFPRQSCWDSTTWSKRRRPRRGVPSQSSPFEFFDCFTLLYTHIRFQHVLSCTLVTFAPISCMCNTKPSLIKGFNPRVILPGESRRLSPFSSHHSSPSIYVCLWERKCTRQRFGIHERVLLLREPRFARRVSKKKRKSYYTAMVNSLVCPESELRSGGSQTRYTEQQRVRCASEG